MNEVIDQQGRIHNINEAKEEIILETIRNLLEENDGCFDLKTEKGINTAVEFVEDNLSVLGIEIKFVELKQTFMTLLKSLEDGQ